MHKWPVVPICEAQKLDVNPEDLLNNGLYRQCDTYKGGGGYDQFPAIFKKRFPGTSQWEINRQFVVQLAGCPLSCPYCYVTEEGVNGTSEKVDTYTLISDFAKTGLPVFHLMGGAPALHLEYWDEITAQLRPNEIFHSDMLLCEGYYDSLVLKRLRESHVKQLHAVSIKGATRSQYVERTGTDVNFEGMFSNLIRLQESKLPFYVTFTGMSDEEIEWFKQEAQLYGVKSAAWDDSFSINLIHYKALDYKP